MNVAFIPVRGGSKSIPLKNIKLFCGKPLVYWTVNAACESAYVDKVYIATDSTQIKTAVAQFKHEKECFDKIEVIDRSKESATDTASTEFAMLEFAQRYTFDNIILVQATSPLLLSADIDRGFELLSMKSVDSVISVVRQKRFNWNVGEDGNVFPSNYDIFHRPRRQEFDGYLVENGAFYITSKERLLKFRNRLSGNIRAVEMHEDTFFEIDEPSDWAIMEALMEKRLKSEKKDTPPIKMLLTDCDGCLTDGGMYYSENGDELKKFNTKDGVAFSLLRGYGILTGIVTGEDRKLNQRRADKLKLDFLIAGCQDKLTAVKQLCEECNIALENVAYIGDEINDLQVMQAVGYSICPADANDSVKKIANYITNAKGGEGVVREVVDEFFEEKKRL